MANRPEAWLDFFHLVVVAPWGTSKLSPATVPRFSVSGLGYTEQNHVPVATWWLHKSKKQKARYLLNSRLSLLYLGWLKGLEPSTTGITILDSTN